MNTPIPIGQRLTLVSGTDIESYRFNPNGSVVATLGKKNGPACGPLFRYSVLSEDGIELSSSERVIATWTRIEIDGNFLRAECDGRIKTFRIE